MRKILSIGLLMVSVGGIVVSAVNLIPYMREEAQSASLYAELAAIHAAGDAESVATAMPVVIPIPMETTVGNESVEGIDSEEVSAVEVAEPTSPPVIHSGLLALHEKERALYDTGVTARYGDKLLTLSTCEYSQKNGRMVVVARIINE